MLSDEFNLLRVQGGRNQEVFTFGKIVLEVRAFDYTDTAFHDRSVGCAEVVDQDFVVGGHDVLSCRCSR